MEILRGLVIILVALGTGCGGASHTTPPPASISLATPHVAFAGRTLDVILSGSGTTWSSATTVSFGDSITVNHVTVASATALVANVTIGASAALGSRDIVVDDAGKTETDAGGFDVESAVRASTVGSLQQGSLVLLTLSNLDTADAPFDTTGTTDPATGRTTYGGIAITAPPGIEVGIESVTDSEIDALVAVDLSAAAGPVDLDVTSTLPGGAPIDFPCPGAFALAAQTPAMLTDSTVASLAAPYASILYEYVPKSAHDLVTFSVTDPGATSTLYVLDESGSFAHVLATGLRVDYAPTSTDPVYVLALDGSSAGPASATLGVADVALSIVAGGEGDDEMNGTSAGAVSMGTPPSEVRDATLSSATDVDFYAVVVPAGSAIHALTTPGDPMTDTVVTFYLPDGVTPLANTEHTAGVDDGAHEDAHSVAVPSAGTYFVAVGYSAASGTYDPTNKAYDLIVALE